MQHFVCLVLKATCSRMLVLLGLVHQTGTGLSELPLEFCALGCCGATTWAVVVQGFWNSMQGGCGEGTLVLD